MPTALPQYQADLLAANAARTLNMPIQNNVVARANDSRMAAVGVPYDARAVAPTAKANEGAPTIDYAAQQAAEQAASNARIREGIQAAYGTRLAGLDGLTQAADNSYKASETQINNTYGSQKTGLEVARNQGLRNLDNSQGQVERNRDLSLRNLADSIRNTLQASSAQLGNYGAADSSASDMLGYALAKQQNRVRGDVLTQVGDQLGEINMKRTEVGENFQQSLRELDTWKANNQLTILDRLNSVKQQILQQRADTVAEQQMKLAALAEVDAAAISDIRNIDSQFRSQLQSIQGSFAGPQIDAQRLNATYDPAALQVQKVNANLGSQTQGNPYTSVAVPRRDENGNPIY